jgi:hypothetical protein
VSPTDRPSAGTRDRLERSREPIDETQSVPRRRGALQPTTVLSDNRRGLTAFGATLVVLTGGVVGALADVAASGNLGWIFGVLFVVACVAGTARSHVDDLVGVALMPPPIYAVIAVGVGLLHPATAAGTGTRTKVIDIGSELILQAPSLLIAEMAVVVIAVVRARRATVARRERTRTTARLGIRRSG